MGKAQIFLQTRILSQGHISMASQMDLVNTNGRIVVHMLVNSKMG